MSTRGRVGLLPTALREHAEHQLLGTGLDVEQVLDLPDVSTGPHGEANSAVAALTEGWHSGDTTPQGRYPLTTGRPLPDGPQPLLIGPAPTIRRI